MANIDVTRHSIVGTSDQTVGSWVLEKPDRDSDTDCAFDLIDVREMACKLLTEVSKAEATETPDIRAIVKDVGMELAPEHQAWCMELWNLGATFAVLPGRMPSRGTGMIAARSIKAQEQVVFVPRAILFTTDSVHPSFKKKYSKLKSHALLAAALAQRKVKELDRVERWTKTWPTLDDLKPCLPNFLDVKYTEPLISSPNDPSKKFHLLPPSIGGVWIDSTGKLETEFANSCLLPKLEAKLKRDTSAVDIEKHSPASNGDNTLSSSDRLLWMWLMMNTRSFYYDMPMKTRAKDKEDRICLCPFIDCFNHAAKGCHVAYGDDGFSVKADRDYEKGEEMMISYGTHNNDLLWNEYGFLLNDNSHDGISLDAWMLDPSTQIADSHNREMLENAGYWRNYTLGHDGPCYRTEMAIRSRVLGERYWYRLAQGDTIPVPEEEYEQKTKDFLREKVLLPCIETTKTAQKGIQALSAQLPSAIAGLALQRWSQIQHMAEKCLERDASPNRP